MRTLGIILLLAAASAFAAVDFVCVADALNIRAEPSPDARVVAVVKYGESLVMAEPRDESGWCKVQTPAGIEGFAFTQYLMRAEDYRVLERVIAAAKRNDVETTAAELAALGASKVEAVWPAPTGDAALVNIGFNRDVILAAGEGVLGSIEVFGATSKALWSSDGKYVVFDSGTTPLRYLYCFSLADEKTVYACNAWDNKYGFGPDGTVLFWVGGQHVTAEELSSPAYDVLAACLREIGQYGGATLPTVEAFDCETRTAYVVLAADPTDVAARNMGDSGKTLRVGMRPCPGAPRPLIAAVVQTDAAGPYTVVTDASQAP